MSTLTALLLFATATCLIACAGEPSPNASIRSQPIPAEHEPSELDDLLGSHRILLMFATRDDNPNLMHQLNILQNYGPEPLVERDLAVIEVSGPADELRRRYDVSVDKPFALLLIGKDTGVKMRREGPVPMAEVFNLIDSMPMRQREMRETPGG